MIQMSRGRVSREDHEILDVCDHSGDRRYINVSILLFAYSILPRFFDRSVYVAINISGLDKDSLRLSDC